MTTDNRHKTTIYLSPEMLESMRALAEKHNRSLNGEMLEGLQHYIDAMGKAETRRTRKKAQSS